MKVVARVDRRNVAVDFEVIMGFSICGCYWILFIEFW